MAELVYAPDDDPLAQLIRDRRSVRAFRDVPVSRELVAGLLRDALWAPSPHNSQPWRFTALFTGPDKTRLAEAMALRLETDLRVDGLDAGAIALQTARSRDRISSAPVIILCSLERDGLVEYADDHRNALEWQMAVQSVGAALQTVFLLASDRGLGSCWMAAPMYCPDVVCDALSLPATFEPQALMLLGYPSSEGRIRPRRQFEDVVELR